MNTVVTVTGSYKRALPAFAYLWNKYAGWDVTVACDRAPKFAMPANFTFAAIGSDGRFCEFMKRFLSRYPHDYFLHMMPDWWLTGAVGRLTIDVAAGLMSADKKIKKISLYDDRVKAGRRFYDYDEHFVRADNQSELVACLEAAIWRTDFLRDLLQAYETPWAFERRASADVARMDGSVIILGVRKMAVHYQNAIRYKHTDQFNTASMSREDIAELQDRGIL